MKQCNRAQLKPWLTRSVTNPVWMLFITIMLIVAATMGAKNLYFRGDYNIYFDETNKQVQAFEEIQATFAKTDSLAVVIAPKSGTVFNPETLTLIQEFTKDAWQVPYSSRVDSLANYQHTEAFEDDLLVEDLLLEDYALTSERIKKIGQIALNEPVTKYSLVSEKGDVAVINITVQFPELDKTREVEEVYSFASNLVEKYQQRYPDTEFYKAGIVALNHAFMSSAQQDSSTLVPIMLLVVLVFLTFMLRSVLSVIATLIVIIGSVAATLGFAGWAGMFMSTATVNVPTLVLTLAVADCVHIIAAMRHQMSKGASKADATIHSVKMNFLPVLITSVTTAIGFFMMNMSDSPVLRDFGNLAGLGVLIACALSLTLLPALLKLLPIKVKQLTESDKAHFMDRLANFVVNNRKVLLPLSVLIIVGTAFLIPMNKINNESVKYFHKQSEFRQAVDFMQEHISGMDSISIAIKTHEAQGIADPQFLKTILNFTDWLRAQPETDYVASLSDVYKRLNKNMHGDDESYYRLPEERDLAAQYLLMYEMSLPYGLDLNNQISIDKSSLKIQLTTKNMGSSELLDLENRIYKWFTENAPRSEMNAYVPRYEVVASSPSLMFAHIGDINMKSMLMSLPISLLLISALMVFALRSLKLGVISLIPNMAPAVIGFGIWALISGEINLGLSVVVSLTLGVVVDDAVHFLSKYQIARKEGQSPEEAIRYAFHTVGRALWITTVVLIAGFGVLSMSTFRLNSDMGQLSGIVIILALVVDFLLLPCLLMLFDKEPEKTSEALPASTSVNPVTSS